MININLAIQTLLIKWCYLFSLLMPLSCLGIGGFFSKVITAFLTFLDMALKQKWCYSRSIIFKDQKETEPPKTLRTEHALGCSRVAGRAASNQTVPLWSSPQSTGTTRVVPTDIPGPCHYTRDVITPNSNDYKVSSTEDKEFSVYPDQKLNFCIW